MATVIRVTMEVTQATTAVTVTGAAAGTGTAIKKMPLEGFGHSHYADPRNAVIKSCFVYINNRL